MDPNNITFGRCPHCKRHKMMVLTAPKPPPPPEIKGFDHIPKE